jgi:hypothetical protein
MGAARIELDIEALRADRAAGMKIAELAEKYCCGSSTILSRLRDADPDKQDLPRKKRHYRRRQVSESGIATPIVTAHTNGETKANSHAIRASLQAFLDGHWPRTDARREGALLRRDPRLIHCQWEPTIENGSVSCGQNLRRHCFSARTKRLKPSLQAIYLKGFSEGS